MFMQVLRQNSNKLNTQDGATVGACPTWDQMIPHRFKIGTFCGGIPARHASSLWKAPKRSIKLPIFTLPRLRLPELPSFRWRAWFDTLAVWLVTLLICFPQWATISDHRILYYLVALVSVFRVNNRQESLLPTACLAVAQSILGAWLQSRS